MVRQFVSHIGGGLVDVNHADRAGWTPLAKAVAYGHLACVRLLLAHGADAALRDHAGLSVARKALKSARTSPAHRAIADALLAHAKARATAGAAARAALRAARGFDRESFAEAAAAAAAEAGAEAEAGRRGGPAPGGMEGSPP